MLVAVAVATSCFEERERPSPAEPVSIAQLSVEVAQPRQGATVIAGRDLTILVNARDLRGDHLAGIGFVVRRSGSGGNATLDSAALSFTATRSHEQEFTFHVPDQLTTNVQLDIFGLAFGPNSQSRVSVARSVVVARCEPFQPGCN